MAEIVECDFNDSEQRQAVLDLMNHYMGGRMGGNLPPHSKEKAEMMLNGLETHPSKLVFLARNNKEYIGLANCFINFGTFAAKPFINIHDIIVHQSQRGTGIGRLLMNAVIERAKQMDCGKITLEVRDDNVTAQNLYKSVGFDECRPKMFFWTKNLLD